MITDWKEAAAPTPEKSAVVVRRLMVASCPKTTFAPQVSGRSTVEFIVLRGLVSFGGIRTRRLDHP
jgi:hypothetical protein